MAKAEKELTEKQKIDLKKAQKLIERYKDNPDKVGIYEAAQIKINEILGTATPTPTKSDADCPEVVKEGLEAIEEALKMLGEGAAVDSEEVIKLINEYLITNKIHIDDLGEDVKKLINSNREITIRPVNEADIVIERGSDLSEIFWVAWSDLKSNNNVYFFGGAGTGKTYNAKKLAKYLNATLITINCNQYTSPLELIGGQTIEGYQQGKLITAWANLTEDIENGVIGGMEAGTDACLLLLDELPKLDPNTAGILNDALAQLKTPESEAYISDSRGKKYYRKNFYCIATGNAPLNREEPDYVANFKQDLSLQDRFMGSIYEVFINMAGQRKEMADYLFIFNYMNKLRSLIESDESKNKSIPSFGFVSIRIMQSLTDTWKFWYKNHEQAEGHIKTLEEGIDSFFVVFLESQREWLKEQSDYNAFIEEIQVMKTKELGYVSEEQIAIANRIVKDYEAEIAEKRKQ
jgi:cobaltochelatase CobS